VRRIRIIALLGLAACSNSGSSAPKQDKPTEGTHKLAGVFPDEFKCKSVTTVDALASVLGGTVHVLDSTMPVPRGVPQPCNYAVTTSTAAEYWTYDIDCRDGMKKRADALFAQYRSDSAEKVEAYNGMSDAGAIKAPDDAGTEIHAPGAAVDVDVGAKALDHHGQGLLFIDDDAPCYVRVVGPDAARRLALAKMVAKNLTFANAPMTPRPMK
jgi:hypothetical protein